MGCAGGWQEVHRERTVQALGFVHGLDEAGCPARRCDPPHAGLGIAQPALPGSVCPWMGAAARAAGRLVGRKRVTQERGSVHGLHG